MNTIENTLKQLQMARDLGFNGTVSYGYRLAPVPNRMAVNLSLVDLATNAITVDNGAAEMQEEWQHGEYGKYQGTNYFYSSGKAGNYIQFVPKLPTNGNYDVYEWHVAGENRATSVPHQIFHSEGTNVVKVNQQLDGSKWNYLGRFKFGTNTAKVRITDVTLNDSQAVIADAIRFVPAREGEKGVEKTIDKIQAADKSLDYESFLKALKEQHQPNWVDVPMLPWKNDPRTGIIKGRVKSGSKLIYNAVVSLPTATPVKSQNTEPHGCFALFEVPPGRQTITVAASGFRTTTNQVDVQMGSVTEINFDLIK